MSAGILVVVLIVIAILLGTGGLFYMQYDFRKKAKNCVCVSFMGPLKTKDELWPVEGKMVIPPESHLAKLKPESRKKVEPGYMLPDGPLPSASWPLWGWPEAFGTEVKRVYYIEGDPRPVTGHKDPPQIDDVTLRRLIKAQAARGFVKDVEKNTAEEGVSAGGIKSTHFWIMTGAILVAVIVAAVLAYMAYAKDVTYW